MQDRCVKMQDRQAAADTFEAKIKSYRARAFDSDLQGHLRKRQADRQRTGRDPDVDPSIWVKKCAKKIKRYRARYFDSYLQVHLHLHGSNGGDSELPMYLWRNEGIAEADLHSSTDDDLEPQQPFDDDLQVRVRKKEGIWAEPESRT